MSPRQGDRRRIYGQTRHLSERCVSQIGLGVGGIGGSQNLSVFLPSNTDLCPPAIRCPSVGLPVRWSGSPEPVLASGVVVVDEVTFRTAPPPPTETFSSLFSNFKRVLLFCARGICQLQTEVIALNRSRSLGAFGRGDAIAGGSGGGVGE